MDRLGKLRITRPLGWIMLYIMPIAAAIIFYIVIKELLIYLSPQGGIVAGYVREISPLADLLLPGLNPYVPILYGWLAIIVAVVVHEASHGIVARSLGMKVKTAGLLFLFVIPIGAFVEVDEKELRETKARNSLRVLAAGSGINFIIGLACLLLLILSVSAMTPAVKGVAVYEIAAPTAQLPSPAYQHGIEAGDFILAMDNIPVTDLNYTLRGSGLFHPGEVVNITIWRNGVTSVITNVTLASITETVVVTNANNVVISNKTYTFPYLGVGALSYQQLKDTVGSYVGLYKTDPAYYIVPPSFPFIANVAPALTIPFSQLLIGFYDSPLGVANSVIDNILFWMFFVNFNLAVFNDLPIYPMDGGQALERFLVGVSGHRISDSMATRITIIVTVAIVAILFATLAGPYLGLF